MPAAPPLDFDTVTVDDVSRPYGRRRALSRVSTTFRAGEIIGLFGPNGAGKSTLLGILASTVPPSAGRVTYGPHTVRGAGEALRGRIGVLGHDLVLYGDLTARENLEFFGRLYGVPDLRARVARALESARLADRAHDPVSAFSRGLRQRLALERALIHDPRLVLLDEPFTGLDDASTTILVERLRALRASGAIVVMATHEFESAEALVDRGLCLRDGRARDLTAGDGTIRTRYRQAVSEAWS